MVSTLFRDPQVFSSALALFGTLQHLAFGSLNRVETLDSASIVYRLYKQLVSKRRALVAIGHTSVN